MRYLLDTNILSSLVRIPDGLVAQRIEEVGEARVYTSAIVAAELRFGEALKGSERLSRQIDGMLGLIASRHGRCHAPGFTPTFASSCEGPERRSERTICSSPPRR